MPENEEDPGANTQMFRAFVEERGSEPPKPSQKTGILAVAVALVIVVAGAFIAFALLS